MNEIEKQTAIELLRSGYDCDVTYATKSVKILEDQQLIIFPSFAHIYSVLISDSELNSQVEAQCDQFFKLYARDIRYPYMLCNDINDLTHVVSTNSRKDGIAVKNLLIDLITELGDHTETFKRLNILFPVENAGSKPKAVDIMEAHQFMLLFWIIKNKPF